MESWSPVSHRCPPVMPEWTSGRIATVRTSQRDGKLGIQCRARSLGSFSCQWRTSIGMSVVMMVALAGAPTKADPIDREGLAGRVLCGYQGWFAAEGDGAGCGWRHWKRHDRSAAEGERLTIDLLPDVSELESADRFPLGITDSNGRPIEVFSSYRGATVRRHFCWMREYGIDGVFVQRFASMLRQPAIKSLHDTVLGHCRASANAEGRVYAVMYDLTGMDAGRSCDVLEDWQRLRQSGVGTDGSSLHLAGRPLVAVWGIGFAKGGDYSLAECRDLVAALVADGCAVLVGVPTGWRTGDRDASGDHLVREIVEMAQAVSPWTVGRYGTLDEVAQHAVHRWAPDMAWCRERRIEYLPVVFPGFSWKNLHGGPLDQIPRRRGEFFQRQIDEAVGAGATGLYVAMFDECDEGTAIFKCVDPPAGLDDRFIGLEGLPSDHYLKLAGAARRRLRASSPPER